ncbi:MAG: hypothetical protein WCG84_04030 [Candidatus Moraniibacteriota bacterium]
MRQLLLVGYGLLFLSYIIAAGFIVFHFIRYSFNRSLASLAVLLFVAVTSILILANALLFLAIPWNKIFTSIGLTL